MKKQHKADKNNLILFYWWLANFYKNEAEKGAIGIILIEIPYYTTLV